MTTSSAELSEALTVILNHDDNIKTMLHLRTVSTELTHSIYKQYNNNIIITNTIIFMII